MATTKINIINRALGLLGAEFITTLTEDTKGARFSNELYDATRDAFIAPQSLPSWILNEDTCQWQPPIAYPDDGERYNWNEETISWDEMEELE